MDNPAPSLTGRKTKASPERDPTSGAPTRSARGLRTKGDRVEQGGSETASPLCVGLGLTRNVEKGETQSHYNNVGHMMGETHRPHCKPHVVGETTSCRFGEAISRARDDDKGETLSHYTNVGMMGETRLPHCEARDVDEGETPSHYTNVDG